MKKQIEKIQQATEALRQQIVTHKAYKAIQEIEDLRLFMQHHIYAVWDFMSLLKCLQNNLTCTTVPWFPKGDGETRYLINEIVAGEESDVDTAGVRKSHFELYLDAMKQCGADTNHIETFLKAMQNENTLDDAFVFSDTPDAARSFVEYTFDIISSDKPHVQAAVFTFGREDLIPNMFLSIVNDLNTANPDSISIFKYYLERHIEVDGDHHSHLALQMTAGLCGDDEQKWNEAEAATMAALQRRIDLWDGVYDAIIDRKTNASN